MGTNWQTKHWRQWYGSRRWQLRREHQLKQQPLCEDCFATGLVRPATTADHDPPHHGNWNQFCLGKLRSLCRDHHEIRHGRMNENPQIGLDGWPIEHTTH